MVADNPAVTKLTVCVDGRLRDSAQTGVASYGHALREALATVGHPSWLLDDATVGRFGVPSTRVEAIRRRCRAVLPMPVRLRIDGERRALHASDIFRLAQVRFLATGRMLELHAPGKPAIMHWTYPIPARIAGWTNLYTVHDVIPLATPHLTPIDPEALRARIACVAATADRLVAVSPWARRAIVDAFDFPDAFVVDCGSSVSRMLPGDGRLPAGLTAGSYFLYCGLLEARKNIDCMVEAWRRSGSILPLVVAGPADPKEAAMRHALRERGVIVLPYQSRPALIDLMAGACALVLVSLEEGFGLPVVEAMALGTPVLTADRGALAETAGDAAMRVDPTNVEAVAMGFRRLGEDPALRRSLAEAGLRHAARFTPAAFGARLTGFYAGLAR